VVATDPREQEVEHLLVRRGEVDVTAPDPLPLRVREVLDQPDTNYWTKTAYTIPDTPRADMKPGQTAVPMVPINKMVPRSFITNLQDGDKVSAGAPLLARGIAFGGDCGVARVDLSLDGGKSWSPAELGADNGTYGFRQWQAKLSPPAPGNLTLTVRCANTNGLAQPATPNWNPAGFMRNEIESTTVSVG